MMFVHLVSRFMAVALPALLLLACAAAPPGADSTHIVSGTATYRERMALPPQAVFEASVEEVSRADVPSARVGEVRIEAPQVPVRFSISVDARQVKANARYVVRARITLDGRLLFTSDTAHPVLNAGSANSVDILLRRVGAAPPAAAAPPQRMSGYYSYVADAATWIDCVSGDRMGVAEEGDNAVLQRAYAASRPRPGATLVATVDGRVSMRPPLEGGGAPRPMLVIDRYIAIGAGPCGTPHGSATLENTYWKLVALRGKPVAAAEQQREPHFILQPQQQRVVGSGGCNRLAGSYTLAGDQISFGRSAGTLMACPQGMDQERDFLAALAAVTRWRIVAEQLDLLDAQDQTLARFEAVALR